MKKQLEKLRAKNKQLQKLFVETKLKRSRKKYGSEEESDGEQDPEYEQVPQSTPYPPPPAPRATPYFFC